MNFKRGINLKVIAGFFLLFYIIIAALFYNFYKQLVIEEARHEVTSILNTTNALRSYIENVQKPVIYRLKKEGKLYHDFFDPKIMSASYIARNIHDRYATVQRVKKNIPYQYKLAATNPRNEKNRADAFEAKILEQFRKGEIKEFSTILSEKEHEYFFTAIPIDRNKKSCMRCHSTPDRAPREMVEKYGSTAGFGEKVGDIRAIISLKIPVSHIIQTHIKHFILTSTVVFLVFLLFYIFIYIISKKELKLQQERLEKEHLLENINTKLEKRVKKEIALRLKKQKEINEKEELLAHQSKLASMGEMIGNIAHQWRQPLTQLSSILINLELFQEKDKLTKERLVKKINEANEQISFMSDTVEDFRNFYASGKKRQKYTVSSLIEKVTKLTDALLKNNKIELRIEIQDEFEITGYPNEVAQALVNIINNAKDTITEREIEHPLIVIRAFLKEGKRTVTIHDNAGGIEVLPFDKIFEPYLSTKHPSVGTGIGLYMSKIIIEKNNNGTISAENKNGGALFTIVL